MPRDHAAAIAPREAGKLRAKIGGEKRHHAEHSQGAKSSGSASQRNEKLRDHAATTMARERGSLK